MQLRSSKKTHYSWRYVRMKFVTEGVKSRRICGKDEGDTGGGIGCAKESARGDEEAGGLAQGRSRGV